MRKFLVGVSLAIALTAVPAVAMAAPPDYVSNDEPSCSLHPNLHGEFGMSFTNTKDWAIPLTVWPDANSEHVFQQILEGGETTPILQVYVLSAVVGWSNNYNYDTNTWNDVQSASYPVANYLDVNMCNEKPDPPTTTTTVLTTEPTNNVAPSTTVPVTNPEPIAQPATVVPVTASPANAIVGVAGTRAARPALAVTGTSDLTPLLILSGCGALILGMVILILVSRRRDGQETV